MSPSKSSRTPELLSPARTRPFLRDSSSRPPGTWKVGNIDPRVVKLLTVLGFALPLVAYVALVQHYQVNALFADQWDDVPIIHQSYVHFPDWSSLWSLHDNNRIFFPNLIAVGLAHTVHYNIDVEDYVSAAMLFVATALFIWSHKRRSPGTPLLFYCPVAFLMLSFAQWQDALWGFQMCWYLVLVSLAATIALIDRPKLTWPVFAMAVLAAVVGSYSCLQGLLIWPVALVLLYHRRRPMWTFVGWIVAAVLTAGFYFYRFSAGSTTSPKYVLQQPLLAVRFFMLALGDVVGLQSKPGAPGNGAVMLFGIMIFVLAVLVLLVWGIRRDEHSGVPVGVALIVYGLLFDALVTEGRIVYGLAGATQSRYALNDVLVLVGIFMSVLSPSSAVVRTERSNAVTNRAHLALVRFRHGLERIDRRILLRLALMAIVIQLAFSVPYGLQGARGFHHELLVHRERDPQHEA